MSRLGDRFGVGPPRPISDPRIELTPAYVEQISGRHAASVECRLMRDWLRMYHTLELIREMSPIAVAAVIGMPEEKRDLRTVKEFQQETADVDA